jgi:hypothetical protein
MGNGMEDDLLKRLNDHLNEIQNHRLTP